MEQILRLLMNGRDPSLMDGRYRIPISDEPGPYEGPFTGDVWTGSDQDSAWTGSDQDNALMFGDSDAAWLDWYNNGGGDASGDGDFGTTRPTNDTPIIDTFNSDAFNNNGDWDWADPAGTDKDGLNTVDPYFQQLQLLLNNGRRIPPTTRTGGTTATGRGDG